MIYEKEKSMYWLLAPGMSFTRLMVTTDLVWKLLECKKIRTLQFCKRAKEWKWNTIFRTLFYLALKEWNEDYPLKVLLLTEGSICRKFLWVSRCKVIKNSATSSLPSQPKKTGNRLVCLTAGYFEFCVYSAIENRLSVQVLQLFSNKSSVFSYKFLYC